VITPLLLAALLAHAADEPAAPEPVPFSHAVHAGTLEIGCLFCHSYADQGPVAGIPSGQRCMGCHRSVATESPAIADLAERVAASQPLLWPEVTGLSPSIRFEHRPHVAAEVACESCHGPVQESALAPDPGRWTMARCLACHTASQAPVTCGTCHL
jgi:hypothetical protein